MLADLLLPVGMAWDAAGRVRQALSCPYRPAALVICIGNLVAGGAGKTPVVLALASDLAARGAAVHIVTRGYGGRLSGPLRVDPARHNATAVGDEALLLAARAPCWVSRDRAAGVRAAVAAGAGVLVLDDGFQNPSVAKDLSLLVVDADYGFGNGRVIPAGPLRENLARGFARADAVVLLGSEAQASCRERLQIDIDLPVIPASLNAIDGERLAGARLLAFAGLGRPEKFFATLRALGAVLVGTRAFPDHYLFRIADIDRLFCEAESAQARLVTTAKDIVRVPPAGKAGIEVLEVEIRWRDPAVLAELMRPLLGHDTASSKQSNGHPHQLS